jgi:hypothetical protein
MVTLTQVPSATETQKGTARIATSTEVALGIDDNLIVTPKKLKESTVQVPGATETTAGIARIATPSEALAGTSTNTIVTPSNLRANLPGNATETARGIIQIASANDISQGTDDTKAVTPLKLKASGVVITNASKTVAGVSRLATFLETLQGQINDNVTVNPASLAQMIQRSDYMNGWLMLSGRMIFQWGYRENVLNGNLAPSIYQPYNISFSSRPYLVGVFLAAGAMDNVGFTNPPVMMATSDPASSGYPFTTTAGMYVQLTNAIGPGVPLWYHWFAIGPTNYSPSGT